eukprot:m.230430 g.230430  ORF g.230430 m.230430 type:complete len:259 (+) comp26456_c9_seq2:652-1428(+)
MYSVFLTHTIEQIREDQGIEQDALISQPFGHANQALISLMLTGQASPYVFDGAKDAGGLAMVGATSQATLGYLTLLEALKYCECGQFLKSPKLPIWVIGSETHMTVLFSLDQRLCPQESKLSRANLVFAKHDVDGNGFIAHDVLPAVLTELQVDFDGERLKALQTAMDPDQMGIILQSQFLAVLYPGEKEETGPPDNFVLYHYNGIARPGAQIQFIRGVAKSEVPRDFSASGSIMRCLRTKWSKLTIQWQGGVEPAIT